MLLLALLLQANAVPDPAPALAPDDPEIVVTARRKKCDVRVADRILSDREFAAHAAEWRAGEPLRVVAPTQADYRCLAKIVFRLNDHGVTRFIFVDPK